MTDHEINVAVAEACGWEAIPNADGDLTEASLTRSWIEWHGPNGQQEDQPPNFASDLNAMHEAEKVLSEKQSVWYLQKLTQVRYKDGVGGMIACMIDKTTFANARQRAEAFLRTLGKWKD